MRRWGRWSLVDDFILGACLVAEVLLFGRVLCDLTCTIIVVGVFVSTKGRLHLHVEAASAVRMGLRGAK